MSRSRLSALGSRLSAHKRGLLAARRSSRIDFFSVELSVAPRLLRFIHVDDEHRAPQAVDAHHFVTLYQQPQPAREIGRHAPRQPAGCSRRARWAWRR